MKKEGRLFFLSGREATAPVRLRRPSVCEETLNSLSAQLPLRPSLPFHAVFQLQHLELAFLTPLAPTALTSMVPPFASSPSSSAFLLTMS